MVFIFESSEISKHQKNSIEAHIQNFRVDSFGPKPSTEISGRLPSTELFGSFAIFRKTSSTDVPFGFKDKKKRTFIIMPGHSAE